MYLAELHSPRQRPTNENGDCLVRRYVGNGTSLNRFKPQHLRAIEYRIDITSDWSTAETVYIQVAVVPVELTPVFLSKIC